MPNAYSEDRPLNSVSTWSDTLPIEPRVLRPRQGCLFPINNHWLMQPRIIELGDHINLGNLPVTLAHQDYSQTPAPFLNCFFKLRPSILRDTTVTFFEALHWERCLNAIKRKTSFNP